MILARIEESAKHKLTSVVRKEEKGRIVGVKGRIVAVDWALGKKEFEKAEEEAQNRGGKNGQGKTIERELADDLAEHETDTEPVVYAEVKSEGEDDTSSISDIAANPEDFAPPSDLGSDEDDDAEDKALEKETGTTLFVRNIQFEATENEMFTLYGFFPAAA